VRDPNEIPGYDKVRERLERARNDKIQKELITGRGIPSQMISKLKNNTPDTGFSMTHKPSKFASSFGTEGSQIVPKKSKMTMYRTKPSPEKVNRQPVEVQHKRGNSNRSKKSSKKNSARRNEDKSPSHEQEEQKAIQQA